MPTRENYHFFFLCESCGVQVKRRKDRATLEAICHACGNKKRALLNESGTRRYKTWKDMKRRCDKESHRYYKNYGGRGITYCNEWSSYVSFSVWAKSSGYTDLLTIERVDVNGNYCPENCTWIPFAEQSKNRRNVK